MGKVVVNTSVMDLINEVMKVECRGEVYSIRVAEEQMVLNTFLKAECQCQGCHARQFKTNEEKDSKGDEMVECREKG